MADESLIQHIAPSLIAEAARRPTWPLALRFLALAHTDVNVDAFRLRAVECGVDIGHLRWRRHWDTITAEELRAACQDARTQLDVLDRLGTSAGGTTYGRLEALAFQLEVELPPKLRRGPLRRARARFSCSDEQVRLAYQQAQSMADLLRRVGLVPKGDNYRVMRLRLMEIGLDPAGLSGKRWASSKPINRRPLEEILRRDQKCDGPKLAQRLIAGGLLVRCCAICALDSWLGKPISLELDHINGEHDDNRLENLRLLCPNCHATTPTYRGRNVARRRERRALSTQPQCGNS